MLWGVFILIKGVVLYSLTLFIYLEPDQTHWQEFVERRFIAYCLHLSESSLFLEPDSRVC